MAQPRSAFRPRAHDLRLALLILLPPLLLLAALLAATGLRHEEPDGQAMEARWAEALTTP